jgi:uncharacterized protein (DUF1330 family)
MPKAYWVTCYRSISDPQKLAAYAKLAPLATAPFGGRYLARGAASAAYESGQKERIVISEFPSVEKAISAYESPAKRSATARCATSASSKDWSNHPKRPLQRAIAKRGNRGYIRAIRDLACLAVSP